MNAAAVAYARAPAQEPVRPFELRLSADERAVLLAACINMSVEMFAAADRAEADMDLSRADDLRRCAVRLVGVEMRLRGH